MQLHNVITSIYLVLNTVKNPKGEIAISDILSLVNNTVFYEQWRHCHTKLEGYRKKKILTI